MKGEEKVGGVSEEFAYII